MFGCGLPFPPNNSEVSQCHSVTVLDGWHLYDGWWCQVLERPRWGSLVLRSRLISSDCGVRQKYKIYRINIFNRISMINMIKITINVVLHPPTHTSTNRIWR